MHWIGASITGRKIGFQLYLQEVQGQESLFIGNRDRGQVKWQQMQCGMGPALLAAGVGASFPDSMGFGASFTGSR